MGFQTFAQRPTWGIHNNGPRTPNCCGRRPRRITVSPQKFPIITNKKAKKQKKKKKAKKDVGSL